MGKSVSGESTTITRVLLVDDHEPFRQQLRAFLDEEPDIQVVGEAGDGRTALRLAVEMQPDAVVMDVVMPHLGGIETTRRITQSFPAIKVLALSLHRESSFVEGMLGVGASGYMLKENALSQLPGALRTVMGGGTYLDAQLDDRPNAE